MDNVVLGTGIGLLIIGAITRRTTVIVVGFGFLAARAYMAWKSSVTLEAGKATTKMTEDQRKQYEAALEAHADRVQVMVDAWERAHPGRSGYYDEERGEVVDAETAI